MIQWYKQGFYRDLKFDYHQAEVHHYRLSITLCSEKHSLKIINAFPIQRKNEVILNDQFHTLYSNINSDLCE